MMSAMQRPLVVALVVGSLLTGYFFFAISRFSGFLAARTPYGRLLGLLGFVAIVGSLISHLWERHPTTRIGWQDWHNVLGLLSVWLILLHSHLHFGNVVATLAFALLLVTVISGGIVTWAYRTSSSPSAPARTREARPIPVTRLDVRRERLVLLHIAVTVGMITFSLFHILAILYY
jgi:uncharacterized iron-regulated membrane protein